MPAVVASSDSVPPTVTPLETPGTTARPPAHTVMARSGLSSASLRRVSDAGSGSASPRSTVAGIGPNSVTSPSRDRIAACNAVASLPPTNTRGGTPRIASQSSRPTIRVAP